MPTLFEIAAYAQMFRRLRGRRPTVGETLRFFDAAPHHEASPPVKPAPRLKPSGESQTAIIPFRQSLTEF